MRISGVDRLNSKAGPRMAWVNKKEDWFGFYSDYSGKMGVSGCELKLVWFVFS